MTFPIVATLSLLVEMVLMLVASSIGLIVAPLLIVCVAWAASSSSDDR